MEKNIIKFTSRIGKEPSKDCFFHSPQRCVGFTICDNCDFHNLEPTKTGIVNRIKKELKEIKNIHKKMALISGDVLANDRDSRERTVALEALDKFNGVLIMNNILNDKFGFKIPDIGSFSNQKLLNKFKKKAAKLNLKKPLSGEVSKPEE